MDLIQAAIPAGRRPRVEQLGDALGRPQGHAFAPAGSFRRVAPFLAATALACLPPALDPTIRPPHPWPLAAGLCLLVGAGLGIRLMPWHRIPVDAQAAPIVAAILGVSLIAASAFASAATFQPLLMLAVLWLAIHHSRPAFLAGLATAILAMTGLLLDANATTEQLSQAVFWMVGSGCLGFAIQTALGQAHRQERRMAELALTDPLVQIPNRRAWDQALDRRLSEARRGVDRRPVSVLVLDLDSFKVLNDSFGHAYGDRVLVDTVKVWQEHLRPYDLLGRIGGDEFAVLLPDADLTAATEISDRMVGALIAPAGASAGAAQWDGGENAASLLARADQALYAAKRAARMIHPSAASASGPVGASTVLAGRGQSR